MSEISQTVVNPVTPVVNYSQQKQPTNRLRHSNLFITLNTNDNMLGDEEQTQKTKIENLRQIMRTIFSDDFVQKCFKFKSDAPQGSDFTDRWFKNVEIQYCLEKGSERGFLHAHVGIFIAHRTKIELSKDKLYGDVAQLMNEVGWTSFHWHPKWSYQTSDVKEGLVAYIRKNPLPA